MAAGGGGECVRHDKPPLAVITRSGRCGVGLPQATSRKGNVRCEGGTGPRFKQQVGNRAQAYARSWSSLGNGCGAVRVVSRLAGASGRALRLRPEEPYPHGVHRCTAAAPLACGGYENVVQHLGAPFARTTWSLSITSWDFCLKFFSGVPGCLCIDIRNAPAGDFVNDAKDLVEGGALPCLE